MLKLACILLTILLFFSNNSLAQNNSAALEQMKKDRAAALATMRSEYENYKQSRDKEFARYLRKRWAEVQGKIDNSGLKPKPKNLPIASTTEPLPSKKPIAPAPEEIIETVKKNPIPEANPKKIIKKENEYPINPPKGEGIIDDKEKVNPIGLEPIIIDETVTTIKTPIEENIIPLHLQTLPLKINWQHGTRTSTFYGQSVVIPNWPINFPNLRTPFSNKQIADWYGKISRNDVNPIIEHFQQIKETLKLNDWGYAELLNWYATQIEPRNWAQSQAITWFLLLQSGFDVRITYNRTDLYVVASSTKPLFNRPFFKPNQNSNQFYILFGEKQFKANQNYFIYQSNISIGNQLMDFSVSEWHLLGRGKVEVKTFNFTYDGSNMQLKLPLYPDSKRLTRHYPTGFLGIFLNANTSIETENAIKLAFNPLLERKTIEEKINLLLAFVQTAFEYKTDQEQFQAEKFMFPEEVLVYKASDCEDRSALFIFLIQNLLNLPIIGLEYPDHVSTAVAYNRQTPTDKSGVIVHNNVKYIHCDPTYINAKAGRVMPNYQNAKPNIISIGN